MPKLIAGQIVRFTYKSHIGATPDEISSDFKEILVLHPLWQNKVHGIDLKRITAAEREVLHTIMDPKQRGKPHKISLINDILQRMDPLEEIKNPMTFYSKFVKVFLRNKDAYRTYFPHRMLGAIVSEGSSVAGDLINPKPLFHKVESKEPAQGQQSIAKGMTASERIAIIKQRAQALNQKDKK